MPTPDRPPAPQSGPRSPSRKVVLALGVLVVVVALAAIAVLRRDSGDSGPTGPSRPPEIGGAPSGRLTDPPTPGGRISDTTLNGQNAVVASPAQNVKRVVVFLHGAGQNSRTLFTDPTRRPVVQALNAAGFAVAASDAAGDGWGNPASVGANFDLVSDLRSKGYTGFAILAESMGGLVLPRLMASTQAPVAAAWYPVCNMGSVLSLGTYTPSIAAAFGGNTAPQPGLSPVSFATQPGAALAIWSSPGDTVVPKAANADVCAAQAREAGINVTETATTGDHGDPSNIQPDALAQFFSAAFAAP